MRIGEASNPGPKKSSKGVLWSRKRQQRTLLDSDSDAPLITQGRFGVLSSDDEDTSVAVSRVPTTIDSVSVARSSERIVVAVDAPTQPKRLRVMTRMSQASTEVAPSGVCPAVPRKGTWVDMTVEDTDDEGVNPVESFDDVVNALERDLVPRQILNGEESFHSAQRGSELLGPSASVGDDFRGAGSSDDHRRVQIPTWAVSVSRAPATAEHGGRFAIFANQEGHDLRVGEEYSEIQQSLVRQDEDIGPPLPPPRSPPPPGNEDSLSDTASCTPVARRRRLSLVWSAEGGERQAAQVTEEAIPQDSHEQRFRRVRAAMQEERQHATHRQAQVAAESIRLLAERIGPWQEGEIPRAIRRHQWSALFVPLIWSASCGDRNNPVLLWLMEASSVISNVAVTGVEMTGSEAVATGWEALRDVLRSRGIRSREDLAEWISAQGFPVPRWGHHFSGRVQERILNMAIAVDARVSALECLFVKLTLAKCQRQDPPMVRGEVRRRQDQQDVTHQNDWEWLDSVSLVEVFGRRVPVLQSCPYHIRGRFRQAVRQALELRSHAVRTQDRVSEVRGWKLFCLLPLMLLRRENGGSKVSKQELCRRFDLFVEGKWETLLHEASSVVHGSQSHTNDGERRALAACRKVQAGEVTRARQCLTGASVAPGTDDTFRALQSRRPQEVQRAIPRAVMEWEPESPLQIDRKIFLQSLKTAPKGSSPGPGGFTYEHLRVLLDEVATFDLLLEAASSLAQAKLPVEIATALTGARLTALIKLDGGVRGIATGCSLRRLVARTLAKQFAKDFETECAPFQYALSTRAGTDCVGHMLRAATDSDAAATVLSVDGIGAYDHVSRSAMLERLSRMPKARAILPFVRLSYGQPSTYSWWDQNGVKRAVSQAEGGEQGDPLMPLLFSIGIQGALEEVAGTLEAGEQLCAFLDDIYVLCQPHRVKTLYDELARCLFRVAGIHLHRGKTRVWNKASIQPEDVHILGPEAWQPEGIVVLGTPLGSAQFVSGKLQARVEEERRLWEAIPTVPDLQCGWQILLQSANPRANHTLRTLPPSSSAEYGRQHDEGVWNTAVALLGQLPGTPQDIAVARSVASLPMRMGGLGLRSAARGGDAAYWASWADALEMISKRNPVVADKVVAVMVQEAPPVEECLAELRAASERLDREGFWWRPTWQDLREGQRPPESSEVGDPGEWRHGRQFWSSSVSDSFFRKEVMLHNQTAARRAHLRSHSGYNAGLALAHCPTAPEFTIPAHLFRTLLLERMHLPLQVKV